MLAFATRTHHTLLENVQILFLTPPLLLLSPLCFFYLVLPSRQLSRVENRVQANGICEEECARVNFYAKIYYFVIRRYTKNVNRIANLIVRSMKYIFRSKRIERYNCVFNSCNLQQRQTTIEIYIYIYVYINA